MTLAEFPEDWQSALVVVAHPDDVEYLGAAPVARWTSQGKRVGYVIASRGEAGMDAVPPHECAPLRDAEQAAAGAEVGVEDISYLDHPDGTIEYGLPLRRDIARVVRARRPDVVLVGSPMAYDGHLMSATADHRALGLAGIDAVRDAANRWVFPDLPEPAWQGVRHLALLGSPHPTHAVDVTAWLEAGVRALLAHKDYLDSVGSTPDAAEAMLRGAAAEVAPRFGGRPGVALHML